MRNPSRLDPAIRAYLQAENDYCDRALADTKSLQEKLFAEMRSRIKEDDSSVPTPDGSYAYYVRYREQGQHRLVCRQPRNSLHFGSMQAADVQREEQVLLDGDELARGKAFFQLGATRQSTDHQLLAWLADEAGSEFYTARVRVIDTGVDLADVVPDVSGAIVWTQDASAFFYVRLPKLLSPRSRAVAGKDATGGCACPKASAHADTARIRGAPRLHSDGLETSHKTSSLFDVLVWFDRQRSSGRVEWC
jgi:oligopeptidase B